MLPISPRYGEKVRMWGILSGRAWGQVGFGSLSLVYPIRDFAPMWNAGGFVASCCTSTAFFRKIDPLSSSINGKIATMAKPALCVLFRDHEQGLANGILKRFVRPRAHPPQESFELREGLLNGRKVGRVSR